MDFVLYNHVRPMNATLLLLITPIQTFTTIKKIDYPTYNIEFVGTPGNNVPLKFALEGKFFFYLNVKKSTATFTIDGWTYTVPKNTTGYYTLIDTDNNPVTKPVLTKKTTNKMVSDNAWMTSNSICTFSFSQADATTNNFLKFIFKE